MSHGPLSILCFGDSLTQGYHSYGLGESPYSITLDLKLRNAFPTKDISIRVNGVAGDFASSNLFKHRLTQEVESNSYDWVILLGGTNDLGHLLPLERIINALKCHWNMVIKQGTKVLALTVPECKVRPDWLEINRLELNQQILAHSEPDFHVFDLYSHLPYHSLSEPDRRRYWDDGLHLTADGYQWMGGKIAEALIQILQQEESQKV